MAPQRIRKPTAIVMDITGTIATKAFMTYSPESREFLRANIRDYVAECWNRKELRLSLNFIKNEQDARGCADGQPPIADSRATTIQQMDALVANILWRLNNEKQNRSPAIGLFHLHMSEWGYRKMLLRTPVYEDAPTMLMKWKTADAIKIYIALGSASLLRNVFSQTSAGDLLPYIDGHMNLMHGQAKDFSRLPELLNEPASKILFITRLPQDARLASRAEIKSVIVARADFDPHASTLIGQKKGKRKERTRSAKNVVGERSTMDHAKPDEEDLSPASKITAKDIREFVVVQRLDEIQWE